MADKYLTRDAASGRTTEVTGTVVGGTADESGKIAALDPAGRLDGSVMPVGIGADTFTGVASGALTAGDFVAVAAAGILRASAASGGNPADGFVLAASADGAAATIFFEGRNTSVSGLTVGSRYYLSDTTPGGLTLNPVTGAGKRHQYLGKAITTTSLAFEAEDAITLA